MYQRKTVDEWRVYGNYGYGHSYEEVTCEETFREAKQRIKEYRENEPGIPFKMVCKRIPIIRV